MKNKIVGIVSFMAIALFAFATSNYMIFADNGFAEQKITRKKRSTASQRRKKKAIEAEMVTPELVIENMEAFVNEYDHLGKQKAVEQLLERGVEFCKKNNLKTACHAFTHTQDFVEGALHLFLIDTRG